MLYALVIYLCTDAMYATGCDSRHHVSVAHAQTDIERDACTFAAIPTLKKLPMPPDDHFYQGVCMSMSAFNLLKASQI